MTKKEKSQIMVRKDHYDALLREDKIKFRREFMEACDMPYTTFYAKLSTDTFRTLEQQLFDSMISCYNNTHK